MGQYIIKRILLMIPTFFAISLLIFVVLQFAPGTPGAELMSGDGGQNAQLSGQQRESYRLFKEQFNLDKPVLFNTRFALSTLRVRHAMADVLNLSGDVSPKQRIEGQETLENWGQYAIPLLIKLLDEDPDPAIRAYAAQRLAVNAQRRVINPYGRRLTDDEKAENKQRSNENDQIRKWVFAAGDSQAKQDDVSRSWSGWFEEHQDRWTFDTAAKIGIFFLDTRFAKYWSNLSHLDFGISHVDKRPVLGKVLSKLKYSITLAFSSVLLIYLLSVPIGIFSATKQNQLPDRIISVFVFVLYSLPSFFVAVLLLNFLTRGTPYQLFPTSGFESLDVSQLTTLGYMRDVAWHVVLPILCMTYGGLAALSRYSRAGVLDVIRSDYIRTARAKGLSETVVILKHAVRNGMIPILTLLATLLPTLIGGSVIIEVVFGIPGMGLYMFESINVRDYNAVMAVLLISSVLTLVGMLLSDISYALVDPRISFD